MMGREAERCGNRHPSAAPHGVYPCRGDDRWCTIACLTEAHWQALRGAMDHPAWSRDERFATQLSRKAHEDALDEQVGEWTQGWDAHELMRTLQAAGVPAGVAQTNRDIIEDPQLADRGHFVYLEHPEVGRHPVQRSEFHLSAAAPEHRSPAPLLGQHTAQVCREFLGMSEAEITTLMQEGVLEDSTPLRES